MPLSNGDQNFQIWKVPNNLHLLIIKTQQVLRIQNQFEYCSSSSQKANADGFSSKQKRRKEKYTKNKEIYCVNIVIE
jgi:hypothetical protein